MFRKIASIFLVSLLAISMLTACSSTVDEPCMYCSHSPSKEYEKSDGTSVYVCEDCSSECMICGREKATKHYESLLGIVFVCDVAIKQQQINKKERERKRICKRQN